VTIGRPPGARDHYGKARRVDPRKLAAYHLAIGSRLRDRRLELDIAAAELAAATGSHPRTIYRIERGERNTKIGTFVKFALALSMSPSELMP
jgi:DNA-binding XRE family transcriptional regulator